MKVKLGVKIEGVQPEILLGLLVVQRVFDYYQEELVITEVTGGQHMDESLHYQGQAMDIRAKNIISSSVRTSILQDCAIALGDNYDFILEGEGTENIHFHLETDLK